MKIINMTMKTGEMNKYTFYMFVTHNGIALQFKNN